VRPEHWHWSEELTELPKGRLRVKFTLSSLEEVERLVLSMGTHAAAVRPRELRERVQKTAIELMQRHGGPMLLTGPDEGWIQIGAP